MDVTWKVTLTACAVLLSFLVLKVEKGDRGPNDKLVRFNRYRFLVVHPDGTLRRHTKAVVIGIACVLVMLMWLAP